MQNDYSNSHQLYTLLDRAAGLISNSEQDGSDAAGGEPLVESITELTDERVCRSLVEAGWFALKQFEVLLGFTETRADALQAIPDVIDRASAYGGATRAGVGAAASFVDLVQSDDVFEVIDAISTARLLLGDDELERGAAAFIASLTEQIALMVAVDPVVVHGELCRGLPRSEPLNQRVRVVHRTRCTRRPTPQRSKTERVQRV